MQYQKFIKFSIITFVVLGMLLLVLPQQWLHTVYHPSFLGIMFLASAVLIYLPLLISRPSGLVEKSLIIKLQAVIALAFILNGLGELGLYQLYQIGFQYDKLAHLTGSLLFAIVLGEMLAIWKKFSFWQMAWRVALIIFTFGIAWELWEMLSDIFFHTQEWGRYGQHNITDTIGDVMWNCVGIVFALSILRSSLDKEKKAWN